MANEVSALNLQVTMASDTGSPVPMPVDIDTPDGSVVGDGCVTADYKKYVWPDKVKQSIEDYKNWLNDEYDRVEHLHYRGPTGEPWPKKPRVDVRKLDSQGSNKRLVMYGQELHEYLISSCMDSTLVVWPDTPADGFKSLENMKAHLIAGWNKLKELNRNALAWHIEYGRMLNQAYAQHELEKYSGKTDGTWDSWLKDNVGISSPQGRKIRVISNLLSPYPGFKKLSLSFSEVYSRRKQIELMLNAEAHGWSAYWQQG